MRLDHIAYRVSDRNAAAKFFRDAFGYRIDEEFVIYFDDEKKEFAQCYALIPPERCGNKDIPDKTRHEYSHLEYHIAPDIFVSEGTPGSLVDNWVKKHGNNVHHMAYAVYDVAATMAFWRREGIATFTTEEPIESDDLIQCFTNPNPSTGIVYELIKRKSGRGFDAKNVKLLMESTVKSDFPRGAP